MAMPARAALINLGCRVNRVELDAMAEDLMASGVCVAEADHSAAIVINTCAVTAEAEAKARKAIRRALKQPNVRVVVATGCAANLFADELQELSSTLVIEPDKTQVAGRVARALTELGYALEAAPEVPATLGTATGRMRPGIKIQDGCDNRCTYCIVWKARGKPTSMPHAEVVRRVQALAATGAAEVVLTGINLGRYHDGTIGLTQLLDALLDQTDIGRIRLSSIEPQEVDKALVELMAKSAGRIAPYLHVPLQAGSDATLRRMGRRYTTADFEASIDAARQSVPDLCLGTDIIVGFPGETDAEAEETLAFAQRMRFAEPHIFRYSKRPGTPAATYSDQVAPEVKAARAAALHALGKETRAAYAASRVGTREFLVIEAPGRGSSSGLLTTKVAAGAPLGSLVAATVSGVQAPDILIADGSYEVIRPGTSSLSARAVKK